jgi:hypothetical protein
MDYDSLQWADEARTEIIAVKDGVTTIIPADPQNQDYVLITQGRAAQSDPDLPAIGAAEISDPA